MTNCEPGDIVLVRFPFTDLTSTKKRPAVVLNSPGYIALHQDVIVMPLPSRPQKDAQSALKNWHATGLPKPTWIKPAVATISQSLILKKIGSLTNIDRASVRRTIKSILAADWF